MALDPSLNPNHPLLEQRAYTIIDITWRNGRDDVGFVLVRDSMGKLRCYVGASRHPEYIARNGARLAYQEARGFFPQYAEEEWSFQ